MSFYESADPYEAGKHFNMPTDYLDALSAMGTDNDLLSPARHRRFMLWPQMVAVVRAAQKLRDEIEPLREAADFGVFNGLVNALNGLEVVAVLSDKELREKWISKSVEAEKAVPRGE